MNLGEVFLDLDKARDKVIYYIKNNFVVESEKLKFYNSFNLKNFGNTNKFINCLTKLN